MTFSPEQLNFFKFSTVVLDEFPEALRQVFVFMWDNMVAGVPKWDDSVTVLNLFLAKEGGVKKVPTLNRSYKAWDCTALFKATLFAQTFAMPDSTGSLRTLDKLYVRPRNLPAGSFHHCVISPTRNQAETYAVALDQLRLLRNRLFHQSSTRKIDKATFDHYMLLAKDSFTALGQNTTKIDETGKLAEEDFPTARLLQVEDELKREKDAAIKLQQIDDHLSMVESQVKDVRSDMKYVKTEVTDVKTQVKDVKTEVTDVKTQVEDVKTEVSDVNTQVEDVKTEVTDVKTQVEDVKTEVTDVKTQVEDVKTEVTDVKTQVEDVKTEVTDMNTQVEDVKTEVTDVKTQVEDVKTEVTDVNTQVEDVKTEVTDVKTQVEDVKIEVTDMNTQVEDVKTEVTAVKTQVKDVGSEVKELKAGVADIKQAMQAGRSKGPLFPNSCIPDKIPHFVGRQQECQAILDYLTNEDTRLVDVWGPPGFGKTSVAINVAHQLREIQIPVYFASLRGMESKDELVSKLVSIFTDTKQVLHISPAHWLIRSLQQLQNPFVLILDNADDLLESRDARRKEQVLMFIDEILAHCNHIKLLFTTRESLDYLSQKLPIHLERVGVLDEVASGDLVKSLLPDVSNDDCYCVLKECGQVPLAMRLMCTIMREENVSLNEILEELKNLPLVEVLDSESSPDDARLKAIINKSFERLTDRERDAFVSLAVFPGCFEIEEAKAVLNVKTILTAKKIIRTLERKSLVDSSDSFSSFAIHSILRSFVDEQRIAHQQDVGTVFHAAQLRFYEYNILSFEVANENFLTGHSNEAFVAFHGRRESIISSLEDGAREDKLYHKAVDVLSRAELFLYAVLPDEELLFKKLYDTAVTEAKKKQNLDDERKLLAAKSFSHWGWLSFEHQTWDHSLPSSCTDYADFPAKLFCYHGIFQILCGKQQEGIALLIEPVDRLSSCCDEQIVKILVYQVLADSFRKNQEEEMASYFQNRCNIECKAASTYIGLRGDRLEDTDFAVALQMLVDNFIFILLTTTLLNKSNNDSQLENGSICSKMFGEFTWKDGEEIQMMWLSLKEEAGKDLTEVLAECFSFGSLLRFVDFLANLSPDIMQKFVGYNTTKEDLDFFCELLKTSLSSLAAEIEYNFVNF